VAIPSFLTAGTVAQVPTVALPGDNVVYLTEYAPVSFLAPVSFEFTIPPEEKIEMKGVSSIAEIPIPGAEGSILQPNGAEPLRISWKGIFEDVVDQNGAVVRRAVDDVLVLDNMRLSGKVWILQYLDIQHDVMIKRFDSTPVSIRGNLDRFEYSIELVKFYPDLGFSAPQTAASLTQLSNVTAGSILSTIQDFFDSIDAVIADIGEEIVAVTDILMTPITAFNGLTAILTDQLSQTGDLINTVVANEAAAITTPASDLELLQQQIAYNITTVEMVRNNIASIAGVGQGIIIDLHDVQTQLQFMQNLPQFQPPPPTTYTVQEGDRIEDIAYAYYGDSESWRPIAYANNLPDPTNLTIGQVLNIPS